ncbi:MAG: oxidoreductase [Bryobacteraceae bacterium]
MWRIFLLTCTIAVGQSWHLKNSGTTATLRGVSVVNDKVIWISGSKGTIIRTVDGAVSVQNVSPKGVADLDFRDIEGISDSTAFAMSSGEGRSSRIYKTTDGGANWTMLQANGAEGFWDAFGMWDATHGILMGDPVDGKFTILTTSDGTSWTPQEGPKAEKDEAAFAGGGSALVVQGTREAWFVTGGLGGGRVLHSVDSGKTWTAVRVVKPAAETAGLYSLAFNGKRAVAVGGDYTKASDTAVNIALSADGVKWTVPQGKPLGYRSAVVNVGAKWLAVGMTGSDLSSDNGATWKGFDEGAFNGVSVKGTTCWAVGPAGRFGMLAE